MRIEMISVIRLVAIIVNDITNFCFRLLPKPYAEAFAGSKTKFLMSLTINYEIREHWLAALENQAVSIYVPSSAYVLKLWISDGRIKQ